MRPAIALLVLLVTGSAWGQERDHFASEMAASVFTTALEFIMPRALEPASIQQLALWGLRGVTTLDPELSPLLADGTITLRRGDEILFTHAAPAETDSTGWGLLIADLCNAAWTDSASVRAQGSQALLTSFFVDFLMIVV